MALNTVFVKSDADSGRRIEKSERGQFVEDGRALLSQDDSLNK
jgi:hypothetical protein